MKVNATNQPLHYKKISPVIKNVVLDHGMIYREIPVFWGALKSHFILLKQLGKTPVAAVLTKKKPAASYAEA